MTKLGNTKKESTKINRTGMLLYAHAIWLFSSSIQNILYQHMYQSSFMPCIHFTGCSFIAWRISYFHLMPARIAAWCFPPVGPFSLDARIRCVLYQFSSGVRSIRATGLFGPK